MSTAGDLITGALKKARILGVDQTPSAEMMSDGLDTLNQMLDSWWLERLAVYQSLQENFSWASGNASRTIGTGGNFSTTRPVEITSAFFRIGDNDYPVTVLTSRATYDAIQVKTSQGIPDVIYYDPAYPLGTIYAYPVPNETMTLYINSHKRIENFAGHTEAADVPPGYERAIIYNLAIEFGPDYGRPVAPEVFNIARSSKKILKRANAEIGVMGMPAGLPGVSSHYNIQTG